MLFSSLPFLIGFLPLTVLAVYLTNKLAGPRFAALVLLAASLIFYSWQTPEYLALILGSISVNFLLGRRINKNRSGKMLALGVAFNLALLGFFKYAGLFSETLSDIARADLTIDGVVLPLAISFFTFQQIAYLSDCLKADVKKYDFLDYALFVAFFPQLIAGPIVHHKDLTPQYSGPRFAQFFSADIAAGLFLFSIGLAKKVLIADGLAPLADQVFDAAAAGHAIVTIEAWIAVLAYSFQIYFDFSGYSDMALGLALLFGVKLPMNFNSPYKATSIVDFWRRWHITLSNFLRDYLYFPLGGNRKGGIARYRNLFIVMLLGGLWHGAAWTFVVWGGLHGAYLCINHAWNKMAGGRKNVGPIAATILTFTAVSLAWVFFRAESFAAAFLIFAGLFGADAGAQSALSVEALYSYPILLIAGFIVWRMPNALEMLEGFKNAALPQMTTPGAGGATAIPLWRNLLLMAGLGCLTATALFLLMMTGPYEFIYFQF